MNWSACFFMYGKKNSPTLVCVSMSPCLQLVFNSLGIGLILNVLPDSDAAISPCLPLAFIRAMINRIQDI